MHGVWGMSFPCAALCRRGPGQEYVKSSLGEVVQKILTYDKSLEIDPIKVRRGRGRGRGRGRRRRRRRRRRREEKKREREEE